MIYFILVIFVTRLYIVRHCETDGNARQIFQGHINLDINELGKKQLSVLSQRFNEINLDKIYTSPLIRTHKTALAVKGERDIPIFEEKGLIELNGGVYEAKTYTQIGEEYPDFRDIWRNHPWDFNPQNGESMVLAYNRIWNTVQKLAKENNGKTIALSTHGGVIRCLLCKIIENDIKRLSTIPFGDNTAVTLLEFDEGFNPKLIYFNDSSHLTEDLKNKNAEVPK